jgi:hypothetical protein
LRLSFAALASEDIDRGVRLLSEALRSLLRDGRAAESLVY